MALKQKTWLELFGNKTDGCIVDGVFIVRIDGFYRTVLWQFKTEEEAQQCYSQWIKEVNASKV